MKFRATQIKHVTHGQGYEREKMKGKVQVLDIIGRQLVGSVGPTNHMQAAASQDKVKYEK